MTKTITLEPATPMLNVSNIKETIKWYENIGFEVVQTSEKFVPNEPVNWAYLKRDSATLMLNLDTCSKHQGESITLYMNSGNVDSIYEEIKDKVKIVDDIRDQFYGMRDFYFEDINGFKFGIGQPLK